MYYVQNSLERLRSPKLKPSNITLRAYDKYPYVPLGLYQVVLVQLSWKIVLIDIEFFEA